MLKIWRIHILSLYKDVQWKKGEFYASMMHFHNIKCCFYQLLKFVDTFLRSNSWKLLLTRILTCIRNFKVKLTRHQALSGSCKYSYSRKQRWLNVGGPPICDINKLVYIYKLLNKLLLILDIYVSLRALEKSIDTLRAPWTDRVCEPLLWAPTSGHQ